MRRDLLRKHLLLMLATRNEYNMLAGLPPKGPEEQAAFEEALELMKRIIEQDHSAAIEAVEIINGD